MGKRHLLTAYAALGGDSHCLLALRVKRRPYFLAPRFIGLTVEQTGQTRRWGARWSKAAGDSIAELGREAGYKFNPDAIMSDTMRAHRLVSFFDAQGERGEAVSEALAELYFEEGHPLAAEATLLEAARRVDETVVEEARQFLLGEAGQAEVLGSYLRVLELGIPSIPCAILTCAGEAATVHGSASPEHFELALKKLLRHYEALPPGAPLPAAHRLAGIFDGIEPSFTPLAQVREAFERDWEAQAAADGGTEDIIRARM